MADDTAQTPTIFVLFGATGDLAKRMVLPAFHTLAQQGLLPPRWRLIGNGRGDTSHEDFAGHVHDVLHEFGDGVGDDWPQFAAQLRFAGGGFDTDDPGSLLDLIAEARKDLGPDAQLVHYFAVPPVAFPELTKGLGEHDLAAGSRVVYEKPYGTSPESFRELDALVHTVLDESQVYRIDHFLGKEATQDLHVLRFANGLFHGAWSREHVEQVQIDAPESLDVADRAVFYDATGAFLDMVVTHLFQVAAEVAMEPPASLSADDLQQARESVIGAFRLDPADVVLGQFEGYRDLDGVADDSTTDTFTAARLWVDTDRWRGVPFLLRTGKRLGADDQRVSLVLRAPEGGPIRGVPSPGNVLDLSMKGDGRIELQAVAKRPGPSLELSVGRAELPLAQVEGADPLAPYVSLLHDVLIGDSSLFTSTEGLARAWRTATPFLEQRPPVHPYRPGSMGPAEADRLVEPGRWLIQAQPEAR